MTLPQVSRGGKIKLIQRAGNESHEPRSVITKNALQSPDEILQQEKNVMSTDQRPMIRLKPTRFDIVLEVVAVLLLAVLWRNMVFCLLSARENGFGNDDLWILHSPGAMLCIAGSATVISFICFINSRFPHRGGYFVRITATNAKQQYLNMARIQRYYAILCNAAFLLCTTGMTTAVWEFKIYLFVAFCATVMLIYHLFRMYRIK